MKCPFRQFGFERNYEADQCDIDCALNRGGQCAITIMALAWACRLEKQTKGKIPDEIAAFIGDIEIGGKKEAPPESVNDNDIPF